MVEPSDDFVLVIVGIDGAEYLRTEVARRLVRSSEYTGDPYFELLLASLLHSPRDHRYGRWVISRSRVTVVDGLTRNRRSQKYYFYESLPNPGPPSLPDPGSNAPDHELPRINPTAKTSAPATVTCASELLTLGKKRQRTHAMATNSMATTTIATVRARWKCDMRNGSECKLPPRSVPAPVTRPRRQGAPLPVS